MIESWVTDNPSSFVAVTESIATLMLSSTAPLPVVVTVLPSTEATATASSEVVAS